MSLTKKDLQEIKVVTREGVQEGLDSTLSRFDKKLVGLGLNVEKPLVSQGEFAFVRLSKKVCGSLVVKISAVAVTALIGWSGWDQIVKLFGG